MNMDKYFRGGRVNDEIMRFTGANYWEVAEFIGEKIPIKWMTPTFAVLTIPTAIGSVEVKKGNWIKKDSIFGFIVSEEEFKI